MKLINIYRTDSGFLTLAIHSDINPNTGYEESFNFEIFLLHPFIKCDIDEITEILISGRVT